MDKATAQSLVHSTLKAPFDRGHYQRFISELCNGFDDGKAQKMAVPDAFAAHVKSCQRLGTFTSPDEELADVLVVHLTESWKLERSRTALRDFVAHKLKRGEGSDSAYKEAGLIAFVAPDSQSWRFSYVRMDYATKRDPQTGKIKTEERLTPARRYSYLVGAEEECHTAQTRFLALLQNTMVKPTLAQIEEAFSVESVTKEFFNEYARLFKATDEALNAVLASRPAMRADFAAKGVSTVDFSKKLLGQIVFLYFIQKKGWLGVGRGQAWGAGPRHFLRQLADQAAAQGQCLFNAVLEPLFYDTLATDRGADAWCPRFQCRIPFLNGGLFEPLAGYDWEQRAIALPNGLFTNRERTASGDIGTGILDVFDRYNFTVNEAEPLEKEVAIDPEMLGKVFENLIEENRRKGLGAFYTPREIVHYMCQESLINYLDTTVNLPDPIMERTDIEALIREGEQAAHYETAHKDGTVSYQRRLPKAIEENARALDEALRTITVCDPAIGSGAFPVGMMTEIVRARMALTPYFVDATERTAYHFKRHAIQNSLYGVDIDIGAVEIAKLRLWLSLVVDEEDVQQIKPLPNLDYKVVVGNSLLGFPFKSQKLRDIENLKGDFFDETDHNKKEQLKSDVDKLLMECLAGSKKSLGYEVNFDFEVYFSEVFNQKGGFDVMIGNPPYGSNLSETERKKLNKEFPFVPDYESADYFVCIALDKIKHCGFDCFIIPNTWLANKFAQKFKNAPEENYKIKFLVLNYLNNLTTSRDVTSNDLLLGLDNWLSFFSIADTSFNLLEKIRNSSLKLNDFTDSSQGLIPYDKYRGHDEYTIKNRIWHANIKKDKTYKRELQGKDLNRYTIRWNGKTWISYGNWLAAPRNPRFFTGERILVREITNPRILAAYTKEEFYNTPSIINIVSFKKLHPLYILALLNSNLMSFYHIETSPKSKKGLFPKILVSDVRSLPIKEATADQEALVVQLVEKIISDKEIDLNADTKIFEKKIDEIIYKIYDINPEEVALIEANCY